MPFNDKVVLSPRLIADDTVTYTVPVYRQHRAQITRPIYNLTLYELDSDRQKGG